MLLLAPLGNHNKLLQVFVSFIPKQIYSSRYRHMSKRKGIKEYTACFVIAFQDDSVMLSGVFSQSLSRGFIVHVTRGGWPCSERIVI